MTKQNDHEPAARPEETGNAAPERPEPAPPQAVAEPAKDAGPSADLARHDMGKNAGDEFAVDDPPVEAVRQEPPPPDRSADHDGTSRGPTDRQKDSEKPRAISTSSSTEKKMKIKFNFASLMTKPKILVGVCSPFVLLVAVAGISLYSINTIVVTNGWVDHTRKVLAEAAGIVGSAVDMEIGMRGYLLAGQEKFLDPYKGGEEATYKSIAALQETVNDNPKQVERLKEAEKVLREWRENVTESNIQLRRDIGDAKTMNDMAALVGEARGKVYFDKFRGQIKTFIGRE